MRVGELEALTSADIEESRCRLFISRTVTKTRYGRFVNEPPVLFEAVIELCPRATAYPTVGCSRA